jgi:glycosyltransferase involved in cell wall biosynthesis
LIRLVHLSTSHVPSRTANSIQVMQMAAAFAGERARVTVFHEPGEAELGDPFAWYGVEPCFALRRYPDREAGARFGKKPRRLVRRLTDAAFATRLGFLLRSDIVYGRSLPWIARWLRSPWAARGARAGLELHLPPCQPRMLDLLREIASSPHLTGLVVISAQLRDRVLELLPGFPASRVLVARSGVDLRPTTAASPAKVHLEGEFRLGYAGGLNAGAGIETVAAAIIGLERVVLHVLGGTPEEVAAAQALMPPGAPVRWHGGVAPAMVGGWLTACDALVAPYGPDARSRGGSPKAAWMSPLKLLEYAAARRPILASDLPTVRELVADGRTALLVDSLDPGAWRRAILRIRDNPTLGASLAAAALTELAMTSSLAARARQILDFLAGTDRAAC